MGHLQGSSVTCWQVVRGYWGRTQFLAMWTLHSAAWVSPQHGSSLSPEWVIQEKALGGTQGVFYNLVSEITQIISTTVLVTQASTIFSMGKDYAGMTTRRQGPLGWSWRLPTTYRKWQNLGSEPKQSGSRGYALTTIHRQRVRTLFK